MKSHGVQGSVPTQGAWHETLVPLDLQQVATQTTDQNINSFTEKHKLTTLFQQLIVSPEPSPRKRGKGLAQQITTTLKAIVRAVHEGAVLTPALLAAVSGEIYTNKKKYNDKELTDLLFEGVVKRLQKEQKLKKGCWAVDCLSLAAEVRFEFSACTPVELLQFQWLFKRYEEEVQNSWGVQVAQAYAGSSLQWAKVTWLNLILAALPQEIMQKNMLNEGEMSLESICGQPMALEALLRFCGHSTRMQQEIELLRLVLQCETLLKTAKTMTGGIEKILSNIAAVLQKADTINFDQKTKGEWLKKLQHQHVEPTRWAQVKALGIKALGITTPSLTTSGVKNLAASAVVDKGAQWRFEAVTKVCEGIKGSIFLMIQQNYFGLSLDPFSASLEYSTLKAEIAWKNQI